MVKDVKEMASAKENEALSISSRRKPSGVWRERQQRN